MTGADCYPEDLQYHRDHTWARLSPDQSTATVGITWYAQEQLGDIVYVDGPVRGDKITAGEPCAVVESAKTASDVIAPIAGEVLEVNAALESTPELMNDDPYGDGWLARVRLDGTLPAALVDAESYGRLLKAPQA